MKLKKPKKPKKPRVKMPGTRDFRVLKGEAPAELTPAPSAPAPPFEWPAPSASAPTFLLSPATMELAKAQTAFAERRAWRDVMFAYFMSDSVMLVTESPEVEKLRNKAWKLAIEFSDFMATNNAAERAKEEETLKPLREKLAKEFGPVNT